MEYFSGQPQAYMVEIHMQTMRARLLLARNIHAILIARKEDQSALARWCRKKPSWLNKILAGKRPMHIDDFDRVADYLGIETYQLLQPGISALTERRKSSDRRGKEDRRRGHAHRMIELRDPQSQVDRGGAGEVDEAPDQRSAALPKEIQHIVAAFERSIAAHLAAQSGRPHPRARAKKPVQDSHSRVPRRPVAQK